jgi:hypothetical protein
MALLMIFPLFIQSAYAQCSSSLGKNASAAASVSFTGSRYGYDIPNNSMQPDNVYATATAILAVLYGPTQNLTLTNFGFSIPSGATICGVVATIKKKAANVNVLSTVYDYSVKLVKNGVVSGNNKAFAGNWTTTNTLFTYGGDADNWGVSLTPADVNASSFGIAFSAYISGTISLIPSAQIDHIQLTVYYQLSALPVSLEYFKANATDNNVMLRWKSGKEINFHHFELERSDDGSHFQKTADVRPSPVSKEYSYTDAFATVKNYYRLKMIDNDGMFKYSPVVFVPLHQQQNRFSIIPNPVPAACTFNFSNYKPGEYRVEIINSSGMVVEWECIILDNNTSIPFDFDGFSNGLYIVNLYSGNNVLVTTTKMLKK